MEGNADRNRVETFRIVLYFFLLFLLLAPGNNSKSDNLRDSDEVQRMKEVKRLLAEKLDIDYRSMRTPNVNYAYNISGIFMGNWNRNNNTARIPEKNITFGAAQEIIRLPSNSSIQGEEGLLSLQLYQRSQFRQNIQTVNGILTLIEGEQDSSDDTFSLSMVGLYFVSTGQLTLFGNTYGSRFHVDWTSSPLSEHIFINNTYASMVGYSVNNTNRMYLSTPSYYPGETTSRCFYKLSLQLKHLQEGVDPEISHHQHSRYIINGTGVLESVNCKDHIGLEMGGFNMDTEHITVKSRIYTLFLIVISFLECVMYIKVLHQMITSTAVPASLTMVFLISAIDLFIAMTHSLAGVFFMGILSELYFISFHKFFVFSVVEMRLLYVIWHSRHTNIDGNNMPRFQRQLSLLFCSLYGFIITMIVLLYLKKRFFYVLVFVLFSFWVPQIGRSLQLGQRPPFTVKQIVLITLYKLAIPSYLFLCPYNLVEMFTEVTIDYSLGRILISWVLLQMGLVLVQKIYNPYTIVPPILRPKKYNYHRIPTTEMDSDCAICMCAIDFEDIKSYMVAPCHHAFHTECLNHWMDVKLECPTCRATLPDVRNL